MIKLNYTSLQHPVDPVEIEHGDPALGPKPPVLRDPAARPPGAGRLGGGAGAARAAGRLRPGRRARRCRARCRATSRELRERGLLCGHITAGPAYGGEHEAISLVGALDAAARRLGWDAVVVGPGPGILGSATRLGHGGMAALDAAHAALALGLPTLLVPAALELGRARAPPRAQPPHRVGARAAARARSASRCPEAELEGWPLLSDEQAPAGGSAEAALDELIALCDGHHDLAVEPIDLDGYAASGLPAKTMGRSIAEDPLFFAAPLAAGRALAAAVEG